MTVTGPVVAVRGEVTREVPPEVAVVSVTVGARDRERQATLARLSSRVDALNALLDGYAGAIERRETTGVYAYPETKGAGERVVGYRGSVTVQLRVVDFAVLGELVLRLADQEQAAVSGPHWALRPDSPAFRQARHDAITDAVRRAKEYAEVLGARITRLLELADTGLSRAEPVEGGQLRTMAFRTALAADAAPTLDLEPRHQRVYASIEIRCEMTEPQL